MRKGHSQGCIVHSGAGAHLFIGKTLYGAHQKNLLLPLRERLDRLKNFVQTAAGVKIIVLAPGCRTLRQILGERKMHGTADAVYAKVFQHPDAVSLGLADSIQAFAGLPEFQVEFLDGIFCLEVPGRVITDAMNASKELAALNQQSGGVLRNSGLITVLQDGAQARGVRVRLEKEPLP